MGKHSGYIVGVCDNKIWYPELPKKHTNVDGQKSNPIIVTGNSRKYLYICNAIPAWLIYYSKPSV